MVIFVGESHSSALGLYGSSDVGSITGNYEGQRADLHPKSKSMLELAYEMDDCPKDAVLNRDKLTKRDIKDKKKATARQKILTHFVNKLDRNQSPQKYSEYERKFGRLKQQVMLQNQSLGRQMESGRSLTYEGEDFADYLLRNLPSDFDEVTEQDNILSYLQEVEDFESESNEQEIIQCDKMIARLQGKTDSRSLERLKEFQDKRQSLEEQISFSEKFKNSLARAQGELQKVHGQEIKDGYNLIPKAADIMRGTLVIGGKEMSAVNIAAIYRDNILCADDFWSAFSVIMTICTSAALCESVATSSPMG